MKKLMTMVGAIMMAASVNASEVETVAFNEARVNIPARVRFIQGENYGFSVSAKDSIVARCIRCTVKDGVIRFSLGNSLQPGETRYDAKKGVHFYGVNKGNLVLNDDRETENIVITVMAPDMPVFRTSADYVAVSVKAVKEAQKNGTSLSMNE